MAASDRSRRASGSAAWFELEAICQRFEAAWREGPRPALEAFLPVAAAERRWALAELVLVDLEYRLKAGEETRVESYLERFAELRADAVVVVDLIFTEFTVRYRRGGCTLAEYLRRFPEHAEALAARLPTGAAQESDGRAATEATARDRSGDAPGNGTAETPAAPPAQRVRCPHCQNPIVLLDERPDEVLCPGCGSSFRLRDARHTDTVSASRPLGKFRLLERVGLGAFGAVWRARDTELDRIVALKIPHAGLLIDAQERERFHREARAAAQLRHPGIVPVHEVLTLEGLPTIVADFVEGVPLRDWLDVRRLTFREAAALVAEVAEALEYAHACGLVHRDIKPANIMIERGRPTPAGPAGVGRPLLLDFGLALRPEAEVTLTLDGHVIGTPAYMSPEQAAGKGHAADRRSDVYSLGVVLYELLCGELPFRGSRLMILQQVLTEEPRPPRKLNHKVPRDLETVCLKCLQKEPGRRYGTARELAQDLQHFLNGEPVRARPVGRLARCGRWCRRNPAVAGLLAALAVVVFGSLAGLTALYLQARHREEGAWQVARFYEDHILAAARPKGWEGGTGKDVTVKQALDHAARQIDDAFAGQPRLEAAVRNALGKTYWYLGDYAAAAPHLEKAYAMRVHRLGPDDPATLTSLHHLAMLRVRQGEVDEGLGMFRDALEKRRRVLGRRHNETLYTQIWLGYCLHQKHQFAEAETVLRDAIASCVQALGPDYPDTLKAQFDLAMVLWAQDRTAEALDLKRRTLAARQRVLGPDHPDTLHSMYNLGGCLTRLGNLEEAEPLCRRSLDGRRRVLGPHHIETLWSQLYLAELLRRKREYGEAEKLLRAGLDVCRRTLGPGRMETVDYQAVLGEVLSDAGRPEQAEPLLRECLALGKQSKYYRKWDDASIESILGECLARQGKFVEAEPFLKGGYEHARIAPTKQAALTRLIELYERWGKREQAAAWRQKRPAPGK